MFIGIISQTHAAHSIACCVSSRYPACHGSGFQGESELGPCGNGKNCSLSDAAEISEKA
jgi:hypothetical protein